MNHVKRNTKISEVPQSQENFTSYEAAVKRELRACS